MGSGHDAAGAVAHGGTRDIYAGFQVRSPVVEPGLDVGVEVDHGQIPAYPPAR